MRLQRIGSVSIAVVPIGLEMSLAKLQLIAE
jgi:hypothetical protein